MADRDSITRTRARAPGAEGDPPSKAVHHHGQRPGAVRGNRSDPEVHEGRRQTGRQQVYAGSSKRGKSPGGQAGAQRALTRSGRRGTAGASGIASLSPRECQNDSPSFWQVLIKPRKASRQSRPASERVPPEILRRITWARMSFSEPLVCSGTSGRSSTISNSALLACSRLSRRSSITKPVRRWKIRPKRALSSVRRRAEGSRA